MLTKIVFDRVDCTVVEVMYSIRLLTMSEWLYEFDTIECISQWISLYNYKPVLVVFPSRHVKEL